jgi:hypothetical protein
MLLDMLVPSFSFHFVNFIRKVVHIQKILCIDEMLILKWVLRKYVGWCGLI